MSKKQKKIIVAKSAGFCWGVNRAFDKLLTIARQENHKGALYTYGPLIHNPDAVARLGEEGVKVIDDIPKKMDGAVFVRTHGISPDERARLRESGATIYDATCPDVGYIQGIVKRHLKRGYYIIIVGNSQHPEVKALLGFAEGRGMAISSTGEITKIPPEWEPLCVVAQSTQKEVDFLAITERLQAGLRRCEVFNTICKSTAVRQEEVRRLCKEVDVMVVVGGFNSANTNKLAQISQETGTPTIHIEGVKDLNINEIKEFDTIGVTAGASTPRWSIEHVIEKLKEIGDVTIVESFDEGPEPPVKSPLSS